VPLSRAVSSPRSPPGGNVFSIRSPRPARFLGFQQKDINFYRLTMAATCNSIGVCSWNECLRASGLALRHSEFLSALVGIADQV